MSVNLATPIAAPAVKKTPKSAASAVAPSFTVSVEHSRSASRWTSRPTKRTSSTFPTDRRTTSSLDKSAAKCIAGARANVHAVGAESHDHGGGRCISERAALDLCRATSPSRARAPTSRAGARRSKCTDRVTAPTRRGCAVRRSPRRSGLPGGVRVSGTTHTSHDRSFGPSYDVSRSRALRSSARVRLQHRAAPADRRAAAAQTFAQLADSVARNGGAEAGPRTPASPGSCAWADA